MKFFHAKWSVFQKATLQRWWKLNSHCLICDVWTTEGRTHSEGRMCLYSIYRSVPIYLSVQIRLKDVYKEGCRRASIQLTYLEPHSPRWEQKIWEFRKGWVLECLELAWIQTKAHLHQQHGNLIMGNHGPDKQGRISKTIKQILVDSIRSPSLLWKIVSTSC